MTIFSGFGPGKKRGAGRHTLVVRDGEVVEIGRAERKPRGASVHTRFKPFRSPQIAKSTAKKLGLHRDGAFTHFESEAQLNRYLAHEKHHGRDVGWKDH